MSNNSRTVVIMRNAETGRYFTGEGLEEGGFDEAMLLDEDHVLNATASIYMLYTQELEESQRYIGRRRPTKVEVHPISFELPEPSFEEGEGDDTQ